MTMVFLESLQYWHWLIFGLILIIAEIFVFGAVLLWFGIAAIIVGALLILIPTLLWMPSILIWSVLSVVLVVGWQSYRKHCKKDQPTSTINRRGEQIVGRHFTLNHDVINGTGELHIDDTRWKIISDKDYSAGVRVKVVAVEGTSLRVEEYIG